MILTTNQPENVTQVSDAKSQIAFQEQYLDNFPKLKAISGTSENVPEMEVTKTHELASDGVSVSDGQPK